MGERYPVLSAAIPSPPLSSADPGSAEQPVPSAVRIFFCLDDGVTFYLVFHIMLSAVFQFDSLLLPWWPSLVSWVKALHGC